MSSSPGFCIILLTPGAESHGGKEDVLYRYLNHRGGHRVLVPVLPHHECETESEEKSNKYNDGPQGAPQIPGGPEQQKDSTLPTQSYNPAHTSPPSVGFNVSHAMNGTSL